MSFNLIRSSPLILILCVSALPNFHIQKKAQSCTTIFSFHILSKYAHQAPWILPPKNSFSRAIDYVSPLIFPFTINPRYKFQILELLQQLINIGHIERCPFGVFLRGSLHSIRNVGHQYKLWQWDFIHILQWQWFSFCGWQQNIKNHFFLIGWISSYSFLDSIYRLCLLLMNKNTSGLKCYCVFLNQCELACKSKTVTKDINDIAY